MVVLVLENVTPGLRGEVRRWLQELHAGIFAGTLSLRVREELWSHVLDKRREGAALMVYSARSEQGYMFRSAGEVSRTAVDLEGLILTARPAKEQRETSGGE